MAPKKIRCNAKDCREAAQRIVGDCGFCNGHFCGKHRLLEDHKCSGLEDLDIAHLTGGAAIGHLGYVTACHSPFGIAKDAMDSRNAELLMLTTFMQCKKQSHERNAAQLESERTQVIRGV
ncbi:AN1-type zinc finger protein TMC1 [Beauveria bassiana]|nr:AN1-type zinc finger protein TMC1 [Beauveria bassiana]